MGATGQAGDGTATQAVVAAPAPAVLLDPARLARARRVALVILVVLLGALLGDRLLYFVHDPLLGGYAVLMIAVLTTVFCSAFGFYRDPSLDPPVSTDVLLVSCLLAVRNEREMIDACIESVLASDYPRLELIVVDDGSDDGTGEHLADTWSDEPRVQVLRLPHSHGKKRALVEGASRAQGEYFVFTDSDCVLEPTAISRVVAAFAAHPEIGAVSGHARALNRDQNLLTRIQDTWYENQFSVSKAAESVFGCVTCVSGPLAAFRREAIYNFLPAWAADTFLGREFRFATDRQLTGYVLGAPWVGEKLKAEFADTPFVRDEPYPLRRWRVVYVKAARVGTVVPWTFGRLIKQQIRWKKSFIRNQFFTGSFYWRRGPVPAFVFYARSLFVLAMPVMLTRHLLYLPMRGAYTLGALYFVGVGLKGFIWAAAYKAENPACGRWIYRPLMSLMIVLFFSPLLLYSLLTIRRNVWARG